MNNYTDLTTLKKKLLTDSEIKREYDRLEPTYVLISRIIEQRKKRGLTQQELAVRMGTKQSAIARFETNKVSPSLDFISRLAEVLGCHLTITS
jgi:ribosome-binding protein aMBF1 (putative translation factor)